VGLINSCGNAGGYAGPYLNGLVKQTTGSFFWASLILSAMLAAGGALMLTLKKHSPE
jgi:MFS transporter, ACS family, tartrate transporter